MIDFKEMAQKRLEVVEEQTKLLHEMLTDIPFMLNCDMEEFNKQAKIHVFQEYIVESEYLKFLKEFRSRY